MAAKSGIDLALVPELIAGSSPASPMVLGKLPRMLARQYDTPDFALRLMEKDVSYAEVLAKSLGMQASVITGVLELYRRAEAQGLGDGDVAGVREADA
jgi:3-hydroxyisobutyrate dehydrogenase/2-hydroxy-3-oxopropionate reductase